MLSGRFGHVRNKAGFLVVCGVLMAGCGSGSDDEAVTTPPTDPVPETTTPTTTEVPTTTTTTTTVPETTTTAAPSLTANGLVWNANNPSLVNAADPQPSFSVDGIESAIEMVLVLKADEHEFCREEAVRYQEIRGGDLANQCLVVIWRYDVAETFRTDQNSPQGGLSMRSIVTNEGRQYDSVFGATALPGTVENTTEDVFPHGGAGTTIYWSTGSNLVGWTQHTYRVPDELPLVIFE